jgi:hypothetical protein
MPTENVAHLTSLVLTTSHQGGGGSGNLLMPRLAHLPAAHPTPSERRFPWSFALLRMLSCRKRR